MSSQCSSGDCSSSSCGGAPTELNATDDRMKRTLGRIKNKIVVMSGKGGVGKSTCATNIAIGLSLAGKKVGLLDVDVHGPSIPRLLSMRDSKVHIEDSFIEPVAWSENLSVMSLGFLLPNAYQPVVWRGPVKQGFIQQLLTDVVWGDLDYMIIDCPPGTGDEPLSVMQLIGSDAQAVIVTTPQGVAIDDVRRSVTFVGDVGNQVLGIIENMSGVVCSQCGNVENIFGKGGGKDLAKEVGVRFLGDIPLDPEIVRSGDEGFAFLSVKKDSPTTQAIQKILKPILMLDSDASPATKLHPVLPPFKGTAKLALPVAKGTLAPSIHLADQFLIAVVDADAKKVVSTESVTAPAYEASAMATFLNRLDVSHVLAKDVPQDASEALKGQHISLVKGVTVNAPVAVATDFIEGKLLAAS